MSAGYQTNLSYGYQTNLSDGYQTSLSTGYQTNLSTGYQTNLSTGCQTNLSDFLNVSFDMQNQTMFADSENSCPTVTDAQLELLHFASFLLEGIIQMTISSLGVLGNAASIFLLSRPELKSSFNQLLAVLASFDLMYLITMFLESLRRLGLETDTYIFLFPYFLYPVNFIALTGSIFMTVGVATERYIAVYHPMYYNKILTNTTSHRGRLLTYLLPITILAIIFNIPKFLESKVAFLDDGGVYIDVTDLRTHHLYITYYHNWFRMMAIGIIPFCGIFFLNISIYFSVQRRRRGRRRKEQHLSLILMIIVSTFVICNLPCLILNMHEIFVLDDIDRCKETLLGGFPLWSILFGFLSDIFLVINSSANLFIYCIIEAKFRKQFCRYIFCMRDSSAVPCRCLQSSEVQPCRICGKVRPSLDSEDLNSDECGNCKLSVIFINRFQIDKKLAK